MVSHWFCHTPAYQTQSPSAYSGDIKGSLTVSPLQSFGFAVAIRAVLHTQGNTHEKGNSDLYQHCLATQQDWSFETKLQVSSGKFK